MVVLRFAVFDSLVVLAVYCCVCTVVLRFLILRFLILRLLLLCILLCVVSVCVLCARCMCVLTAGVCVYVCVMACYMQFVYPCAREHFLLFC